MSGTLALRSVLSPTSGTRRTANLIGFLACAGLIGYALYAQFHLHLSPCPLCIFQRIGVAVLGVVFLAATVHHPRRWGAPVYAVLIGLAALATAGVSARQIYLQHLPFGSAPSCGAPLAVMLQYLSVTDVIRKVLSGSGECALINWTFLGLAMSEWVLIWVLALGTLGVVVNLRRLRRADLSVR